MERDISKIGDAIYDEHQERCFAVVEGCRDVADVENVANIVFDLMCDKVDWEEFSDDESEELKEHLYECIYAGLT